jgi:hypothetical protein
MHATGLRMRSLDFAAPRWHDTAIRKRRAAMKTFLIRFFTGGMARP